MSEYQQSDREKFLRKIFRLEDSVLKNGDGDGTDEQRCAALQRMHETELDREYRGKGHRYTHWYPQGFLEEIHKGT